MRQMIAAALRRAVALSGALDGYEHPELVETIFQKTKAYQPQAEWQEMQDVSSVLDFGGGCGVHYKQARSSTVRWAVVETPAMVKRASELTTDRLRFFTSITDAKNWLGDIEVMYSRGALHYVTDPARNLLELCQIGAKTMRWDSVCLSADLTTREAQLSLMSENGPEVVRSSLSGKAIRYTKTEMPEPDFLAAHRHYDLAERGSDWFRFVTTSRRL